MSLMKCPHCGITNKRWRSCSLIPKHTFIVKAARDMKAAALESGASEEEIVCPGSGQYPRCAASDKRPLWKDGGCP